jgi:hypothetical protein
MAGGMACGESHSGLGILRSKNSRNRPRRSAEPEHPNPVSRWQFTGRIAGYRAIPRVWVRWLLRGLGFSVLPHALAAEDIPAGLHLAGMNPILIHALFVRQTANSSHQSSCSAPKPSELQYHVLRIDP